MRLARHGLAGTPELRTPLDVAERMLAVQSQDYPAGKWALGVRAPGVSLAEVNSAIDDGLIVRSWPMRGTLHLVPAPELNWMAQLTTPRLLAAGKTRRAQLEIDDATVEHAREAAVTALEGGRRLTRAGFLEVLEEAGISIAGQRGYHLIGQLAQTGTVCWGPHEGRQQALVLQDEWIPNPRILTREEALGEFVLRYFHGHGPATLKDFAWWSKLTVAEAKTGLAVVRSELADIDVDGATLYFPASADTGQLGSPPRQRTETLLLPPFDEYLLGYTDRSFAIEPEQLTRVVPGKNGIFLRILVAEGRIIGTWRVSSASRAQSAEPEPFEGMSADQYSGFERAVREYADFLGSPVTALEQPLRVSELA
jgi:hypothetical protein